VWNEALIKITQDRLIYLYLLIVINFTSAQRDNVRPGEKSECRLFLHFSCNISFNELQIEVEDLSITHHADPKPLNDAPEIQKNGLRNKCRMGVYPHPTSFLLRYCNHKIVDNETVTFYENIIYWISN